MMKANPQSTQTLKNRKLIRRRTFLRKSAYGLGGMAVMPSVLSAFSSPMGANDRIMLGHIGLGNRGSNEMKRYFLPLDGCRSVAFCDVWEGRRNEGLDFAGAYYKEQGMTAPERNAYLADEEVLARDDIEAVHITTPDHWHVPGAIRAARAGKHIMLAKPLGLSYPNYLILKEELKRNDVRFHYGTQQRTMKHMQLGIDMIREGKIGAIESALVWSPGKNPVDSPVCHEVPVPDDFDFERWTGPAPLNTYCPDRVTNNSSWFQYDYSIGFLAGWGAHPLDVLVWGIRDQVSGRYAAKGEGTFWAEGGIYDNIYSWDVHYQYESGVNVHFLSWDRAEQEIMKHRTFSDSNGTTFFGPKGWISLSRHSAESSVPELHAKLNDFPRDDRGRIRGEQNIMGQAFLDIIHGKTKETCPLDEAIISDTISHMGDIAIRMGTEVSWDPGKGEVSGAPGANELYVREMRPPYTV